MRWTTEQPEPLCYIDEIAPFTEEDFYRMLNRKRIPVVVDPTLPDDTIRIGDNYLTGIKVVDVSESEEVSQ